MSSKFLWRFADMAWVIFLSIVFAYYPLLNTDIFWHLKAGAITWQQGAPLVSDPFTYTLASAPWHNHEWLAQLIFAGIFTGLGLTGLMIFKIFLVIVLAGLVLIGLCRRGMGRLYGWVTLFFVLWMALPRLDLRPHLLAWIGLLAALLLIESKQSLRHKMVGLVAIQILWANLHGSAFLLPVVLALFVLEGFIHHVLKKDIGEPLRYRLGIFITVTLAGLINPFGIGIYTFPLAHQAMSQIMRQTGEWLGVMHPHFQGDLSVWLFKISLVGAVVTLATGFKKMRFLHLGLVVLFSLLPFVSSRWIDLYALVALPLTIVEIKSFYVRKALGHAARGPLRPVWILPLVGMSRYFMPLGVLALATYFLLTGVPRDLKGELRMPRSLAVDPYIVPAGAVDFMDTSNIRGRAFNSLGFGSYLDFRRYPARETYIDTRTPLFGDAFYAEFLGAHNDFVLWSELEARWHFDYIFLDGKAALRYQRLHQYLWHHPDWALVYVDPYAFIYVRDTARFADVIAKHRYQRHPLLEEIGLK